MPASLRITEKTSELLKLLESIGGDELSVFRQVGFSGRGKGFSFSIFRKNIADFIEFFRGMGRLADDQPVILGSAVLIQRVFPGKISAQTLGRSLIHI